MKKEKERSARQQAYSDYLLSAHWKNLKSEKRSASPKKCASCNGDERVQLHHMRYRDTFQETRLNDLLWLCRGCHQTFHARAGVRIKDRSDELLITATIRVIQAGKPGKRQLTRKERRRVEIANKRELRAKRRAEHEQREAANRAEHPERQQRIKPGSEFNRAVSHIKPRSPLNSTKAGMVVCVPPTKKGFPL